MVLHRVYLTRLPSSARTNVAKSIYQSKTSRIMFLMNVLNRSSIVHKDVVRLLEEMDSKNTSKTIVKTQRLVVSSVAWEKKILANKSSVANFMIIYI